MKFGLLRKYNERRIFPQKSFREWFRETSSRLVPGNESGRLVPDLFLFFQKPLWGKSKLSAALFQYISIAPNLSYNKIKLYKIFNYWFRDMLKFRFFRNGSEYSFSSTSCVRLQKNLLYSINWPSFIAWLIFLTSWDTGESVYWKCLSPRLWRHKV